MVASDETVLDIKKKSDEFVLQEDAWHTMREQQVAACDWEPN